MKNFIYQNLFTIFSSDFRGRFVAERGEFFFFFFFLGFFLVSGGNPLLSVFGNSAPTVITNFFLIYFVSFV